MQWRSPASQFKHTKLRMSVYGSWTLCAAATGKPQPILEVAAQACFWGFKKPLLMSVCKRESVETEPGADDFDLLWRMVEHFLPGLSSHQVLDIVAKRLAGDCKYNDCVLEEILQLDEAVQCLDKAEEDDVRQEQKKVRAEQSEHKAFLTRFREKRATVVPPASKGGRAGGAAARGRGNGRGGSASSSSVAALRLPEGDLQQRQVKHLLPPGCSIWRSNLQGSWQGHCPPFRRCSASWHLYGHRFAAVLVLRKLWAQHLEISGGVVPQDCLVEGLFSVSPEEAEAGVVVPPRGA